jgi:hypothetical protein
MVRKTIVKRDKPQPKDKLDTNDPYQNPLLAALVTDRPLIVRGDADDKTSLHYQIDYVRAGSTVEGARRVFDALIACLEHEGIKALDANFRKSKIRDSSVKPNSERTRLEVDTILYFDIKHDDALEAATTKINEASDRMRAAKSNAAKSNV